LSIKTVVNSTRMHDFARKAKRKIGKKNNKDFYVTPNSVDYI